MTKLSCDYRGIDAYLSILNDQDNITGCIWISLLVLCIEASLFLLEVTLVADLVSLEVRLL